MIQTRECLIAQEDATLAPYAQKSGASAGRAYPEPPHPYRTEYQRDCARIIHSRAFRRLEYKTQVFLNGTGDHLRTRLTHTMEVASISRSVARALAVNQDLTEAIALAHDLGHPPFGHSGERAIDEKMRQHGGFDHNEQSLRILQRIEKKYPNFEGVNLTFELIEGLQKHRNVFHPPSEFYMASMGETAAETPSLPGFPEELLRTGLAKPYPHPSLEAQIANMADEIAYYSHDLDDGLDCGLISAAQLNSLEVWHEALEYALSRYPNLEGRELHAYVIRCMIDREVEDVIQTSSRLVSKAGVQSADEVRQHPKVLICYSDRMRDANRQLRKFLYENLYYHPEVAGVNERACEMLKRVFDAYLQRPEMLGEATLKRVAQDGLHRAVCDYLSGMTDRYLQEDYVRLFGG